MDDRLNCMPVNFDRLARIYRVLEYVAFGRDLERARFHFLSELANSRQILVLGEGDGRCLERLVEIAPAACIHCYDASPAMLACSDARLSRRDVRSRVTFHHADVLQMNFDPERYDAVVTMFFLDCFSPAQVTTLVAKVTPCLKASGLWLFADFVLPRQGAARWRAHVWLTVLYRFFRWQTGLATQSLPPSEEILRSQGLHRIAIRDFQGGLVRSAVYERDTWEQM